MRTISLALVLVLALAFLFPGTALAGGLADDQVIFGGTFLLESGETLDGSLLVFGGSTSLEPGSLVEGDVVSFGGTIEAAGEIEGDLVVVGGSVRLEETALIRGSLLTPGGAVSRSSGAQVQGEVITGDDGAFVFPMTPQVVRMEIPAGLALFGQAVWFFFRTLAFAAIAVLVALVLPEHTRQTGEAALRQPMLTGGVGLLTLVVAPPLLILLALTLVLIPVSILGLLLLGLAVLFGWVALGLEVGRHIEKSMNQDWGLPITAGVGTFVLGLVSGVAGLVDCIGWLVPMAIVLLGLGSVLLTRFGSQRFPPPPAPEPVPPALPAEGEPSAPAGE